MSPDRAHILVVEDEAAQREILRYNLEAEGYSVAEAADGDEALLLLEEEAPDLVLLDWMLPGVSGIEICRRIKRRASGRDLPVIMLSARSEEVDRVRGLETGADDYMVKPFSLRELMARVRLQLRRTRPGAVGARLQYEALLLEPEAHRASWAGQGLKLGPLEFRLLSALMEHPGRVWSRESLLRRVWGREHDHDTRTVDVHVARLRKALKQAGAPADLVRTIRSEGYALGR